MYVSHLPPCREASKQPRKFVLAGKGFFFFFFPKEYLQVERIHKALRILGTGKGMQWPYAGVGGIHSITGLFDSCSVSTLYKTDF